MKITNDKNLPIQFVNAVRNDDYDGPKATEERVFSVTTLLDSPNIKRLKREHYDEITEDVSDKIWMLLGKGVHTVLESGARPGDLFEERLKYTITVDDIEVTISGAFDYFNMLTKTIQDYKTTSVYTRQNADRLEEYKMQLNIYAWLLWKVKGIRAKALDNLMIYKDYSKAKRNAPANVEIISHQLLSLDEVEQFIVDKVRYHLSAPTECTEHERWAKPDTFAIMKEDKVKALKVCKSLDEAKDLLPKKKGDYIEVRPASSGRCEFYCSCKEFCPQYKKESQNLEPYRYTGE